MIDNCLFETTTELMDNDGIPYAFLNLYDVEGIYLKGCTFKNTNEDAVLATDLGIGILAYDASFYVIENTSSVPCSFESLYYGVKHINTNTSHASVINTASFSDNYFAAYFSGVTGATIIKNDFDINQLLSYGVYLDQCNAWQLEENDFNGTTSYNTFGVVVNNSGAVNNEIYNNTFSNLKYGIEAIDKNRGVSIRPIGLKIKCNDFSSCSKDIFITQNGSCSPCGIAKNQGVNSSVTSPAGNTFSHTGPANQYTDIDNIFSSYPITYYRHSGSSGSWIPLYYRNLSQYVTSYTYSKSTACPSSFGVSGRLQIANLEQIEARIDSLETLYISIIDNGNTQALSQEVSNALSPDALDIRADLLAISPYVSDTVLAEAVKNEVVLNPFMLKNVLNANTHGIKSNKVQDAIVNRTNPLPVNILSVILDGLNSVSAKEVLEAEISEAHSFRKNLINLQIRNWLLDTSGLGMESMLLFAQDCNDWDVKAVLIFKDSTQMVTGIPNINAYYQISNVQRAFQNDGRTLFDLSEQEKSVLNSLLANEDGFADMYALNMLRINGDTNYREPLVLYSEEVENKYPVSDPLYENMPGFQLFPNPARSHITIAFNEELQNPMQCELIDAKGVIRAKYTIPAHYTEYYIDLRLYTAGNYFLRLYNDIALKTIHKFIIY